MAGLGEHVAHGLRSAQLIEGVETPTALAEPAGMVVLRDDDTLESFGGEAERWLRELPADHLELPLVVYEVAQRARMRADVGGGGPPATARVRLSSGRWLVLYGARLHATEADPLRTVVVLEPARRADLAPLIVAMYELTERERDVTQFLVRGMPLDAIADTLCISKHAPRPHQGDLRKARCNESTRADSDALPRAVRPRVRSRTGSARVGPSAASLRAARKRPDARLESHASNCRRSCPREASEHL